MVNINPGQIVYLEHADQRLYTEVIQLTDSQRLWCRPLMLVCQLPQTPWRQQAIEKAAHHPEESDLELYDLKTAPDLLWPLQPFQPAFDTDFFSLLFYLRIDDANAARAGAKQKFDRFIQTCWHDSRDSDQKRGTALTTITSSR